MSYTTIPAYQAIARCDYPDDALFFFDFDGVLATQCEDKMFRLPPGDMERRKLEEMARFANIDPALYPDTGYLRHLVYQGYAYGTVPEEHLPVTALARCMEDWGDPYFIVTARSGTWAVRRLLEFVDKQGLHPQEVFCLGRSSKAILLSQLREDWPDRPFVFFEDTQRHIDACVALDDPLLQVVKIEWPTCTENAEWLKMRVLGYT